MKKQGNKADLRVFLGFLNDFLGFFERYVTIILAVSLHFLFLTDSESKGNNIAVGTK